MEAVVKEEEDSVSHESNMIEPKEEVIDESFELIEPKVELIDVKIEEEIDEDAYQHIIPYEYRDYLEQCSEEQKSVNSRKRPAEATYPKRVECQKCCSTIMLHNYTKAENHAATHTNIYRFSCPVAKCDYKGFLKKGVTDHMKNFHKFDNSTMKDVVLRELSHEESEVLRTIMEECFPEVERKYQKNPSKERFKFNCRICNFSTSEISWWSTSGRRNHALIHSDIMLYNCIEPDCEFKTKFLSSYRRHQMCVHNTPARQVSQKQIELTMEQKLEVERRLIQCFPELKGTKKLKLSEIRDEMKNQEKAIHQSKAGRKQSCDVCQRAIHPSDMALEGFRRFHALTHTDIKLYKCCGENCDYKANWKVEVIEHHKTMHQINIDHLPIAKIELTNEQEMEIKTMMDQCFPEWNNE